MDSINRQLLIGLGTGRCGTVSLGSLLNAQPDTTVIHEGAIGGERHLLPWDGSGNAAAWFRELARRTAPSRWFGDVGMYFLPYVEDILEEWPTARFITLRRSKEETVASYLKKTEGRNHWVKHDGTEWRLDERWDIAYPKYPPMPKADALRRYWEEYYHKVGEIQEQYPESISTFDMHLLNESAGREAILDFACYSPGERRVGGYYHENYAGAPVPQQREVKPTSSGVLSRLSRRIQRGFD